MRNPDRCPLVNDRDRAEQGKAADRAGITAIVITLSRGTAMGSRTSKTEVDSSAIQPAKPVARARKPKQPSEPGAKTAAKPAGAKPRKAPAARRGGDKALAGPLTPEQRYRYVAEAAFYIAQRRGFVGGDPAQDWLEAEAEIERRLAEARP